jgi:hypothetical protein
MIILMLSSSLPRHLPDEPKILERETGHSWELRHRNRLGPIGTMPTLLNVTNFLIQSKLGVGSLFSVVMPVTA